MSRIPPKSSGPSAAAADLISEFPVSYPQVLAEYLAHPDESTLQQAYELGRAAMNAGLGVLDVIRLHHRALAEETMPVSPSTSALESFLLEALAPFEAAYRGFRGARERLQQINGVLALRNEELSRSNSHLEQEIRTRQKVESALRESKDHYFKLFHQAHAMEEDLRDLSAKLLSAQEDERKRISRELHDEIGQALTAVNVAIAMLKKQAQQDEGFARRVSEAEQLIAQTMETVHCFARELRPAMLDHLGIHSALRAHVGTFTRRTGIKTELVAHPDLQRVEGPRAEALFRVVQEALNNVFKHAKATAVKIEMTSAGDALRTEIADNGCAFSTEEKFGGKPTGRLGLLVMQERVRNVNGTFSIESKTGRGTRILVQIPMSHPAGPSDPGQILIPLTPAASLPAPETYENHIRTAC